VCQGLYAEGLERRTEAPQTAKSPPAVGETVSRGTDRRDRGISGGLDRLGGRHDQVTVETRPSPPNRFTGAWVLRAA